MKVFIAGLVGLGLTMLPAVTQVTADENGEVHAWTAGSTYVPSDERGNVPEYSSQMLEMRMAGRETRIYQVSDDPAYDLSGTSDQWFLVGDGTAFHQDSWRSTAAFASAGGVSHEIVPVPAEYRQDWLAVAAGDRPVRTFTPPHAVMDTGAMASSAQITRTTPARNADTFRPVQHPRRQYRAHYTAMRHRTYHRRHHAAMTAMRRAPAYRSTQATMAEPAVTAGSSVEVRHDEMGHELLQIGTSWYMKDNGEWFRSESWRGPFARVRKGTVPREVRMSEKHPSRMDMD